jgi:hypothetical protein
MDAANPPIDKALDALRELTFEQIRARLAEIAEEEVQLRVLARAAKARERQERRQAEVKGGAA